jgi:two-component system sensor histidine kinase CreC
MHLSVRFRSLIVLSLAAILAAGILYNHVWKTLEIRYREAVEENMVDQSQLLASMLSTGLPIDSLQKGLEQLQSRRFEAKIYKWHKTESKIRVYVTDSKGIVLYHSEEPYLVGQDFSGWRDVALTLQGHYGARSTRDNEYDESSSVLHVAAPIMNHGKIKGVVTVAKPTLDFDFFIEYARRELRNQIFWALGIILILGIAASFWVASPMGSLRRYAKQILRQNKKNGDSPATRPTIREWMARPESADVHAALDGLQSSLQDKAYVEHYVQVLTHELKSPLTAIQGAAEILEGELHTADRQRFLQNIQLETSRMRELVDAILTVSALERTEKLENSQSVSIIHCLNQALDAVKIQAHHKQIQWKLELTEMAAIPGNALLMRQALHNIILNAVEHSPLGGEIQILTQNSPMQVIIQDQGKGIPDYAFARLGQKFYSLPKPDTGRKGTGLGLSLVQEAARLHNATIRCKNRPDFGAEFSIIFGER